MNLSVIQFTYFSVGALLVLLFHAFASFYILFRIRKKSPATRSLGLAFLFLCGNSLAFLIAYSVNHPLAATHRWFIPLVLPALLFFTNFFIEFPRPLPVRIGRILFYSQVCFIIATLAYYVGATYDAPVEFVFDGHYWTFVAVQANQWLGRAITFCVLVTFSIGIWQAIRNRGRDRLRILGFLVGMSAVMLIPGIANSLSRAGAIDRSMFMTLYTGAMVPGVFLLLLLHINTTRDRTSFMAKIVGITFATFLLLAQWLSITALREQETAFDTINLIRARLYLADQSPAPGLSGVHPADANLSGTQAKKIHRRFAKKAVRNQSAEARGLTDPFVIEYPLRARTGKVHIATFRYEGYRAKMHESSSRFVFMILLIAGVISIGFRFFFHGFLEVPLSALVSGMERVDSGNLSVQIPVRFEDEIGFLTRSFNRMVDSIREARADLENYAGQLENKVKQRTAELADIVEQQHGDYYLTSLLVKPLGQNMARGREVRVEFFTRQKKQFVFRDQENEIGGDMCSAASIELLGKAFTVFINADAMGKSMQGAGGALVLGSVFRTMVDRTRLPTFQSSISPQRWLKNGYVELQSVFEAFDCSMMISAVMGLVDDENGLLYFVNVEHPQPILYRNGCSTLVPVKHMYRKFGTPHWPVKFFVQTLQMRPGDVLIIGSDGKDDLLTGIDDHGNRLINNDEYHILSFVDQADGILKKIYELIQSSAGLTDDFSLLRIEYITPGITTNSRSEKEQSIAT